MIVVLRLAVRAALRPHRILPKIRLWVEAARIGLRYDQAKYELEQADAFRAVGLDYEESKRTLDGVYTENPKLLDPFASCHHNVFAALSKARDFQTILEIGTHSGKASLLLSKLFPRATIDTIDLPDDHPVSRGSYARQDEDTRAAFTKNRDATLQESTNISFTPIDSITLVLAREQRYDFIWIDGDHDSPMVVMDITNSLRLLNPGGVIACDDVFTKSPGRSDTFNSMASIETIHHLQGAGLVDCGLVFKRTKKPYAHPLRRKFIALLWLADSKRNT